jgi:arylsulfatase A-like enzyme
MAEEDVTVLTALYDGALRYLDARLAEMVAFLQARGCWERTVFVVTADHGEHLGEHGRFGHALGLHDDVLRVPLLIRCPTRVPQGFTVDELAQTTDILPTVVRLAGLTADTAGGEGRCLLEDGRVTQGPSFAVAERFRPELSRVRQLRADFDVRPHDVRLKAIRTKRMKFVWHSDEANELYDIATDPGETCNLVEQESERAEELRRELFDWLATVQRRAADGAGTNEAEAERTVGRVQRPA